METIEITKRVNVLKFKNDIKKLSEKQIFFKNQRKTVNLIGERKIEPTEATWKHQLNRERLRIMYAAYGLMNGKNFSQIENKYTDDNHPLNNFKTKIDNIINSYQ